MTDEQSTLDLGSRAAGGGRVRLLHSADWQLGLLPAQLGERAEDARQLRFAAAERCVELAHERQVDLVLLAGDTFDSPDLDEGLFRRALDLLERFAPIPVLLLPGNHDPAVAGGIWQRRGWQRAGDHLRRLTETAEVEVGGVAVYPCPVTQKRSRHDPTDWLPAREEGDRRLRIGFAHGSLSTLGVASNFPIDAERVERCGLDYLALGDWHGLAVHGRAAYPGTVEPTSFGEIRPGHVLIVDLAEGEPPAIEPVPVGRSRWRRVEAAIGDANDLAELRRRIAELGGLDDLVLRLEVTVRGAEAESRVELEELRRSLGDAAWYLDWRSREELASALALPPGLLHEIDEVLVALEQGRRPPLPLGDELEELAGAAGEARLLLHRLVGSER